MSTSLHEEVSTGASAQSASWRRRREQAVVGALLLILLLVALVAAFGSPVWQLLSTATIALALVITALLAISLLRALAGCPSLQA